MKESERKRKKKSSREGEVNRDITFKKGRSYSLVNSQTFMERRTGKYIS